MPNIFICPEWFFGYDIALEVIFAIVAMMVSFYAWKIFKITDERNIKLFSLAFFFISLSYIAQSALNVILLTQMEEEFCGLVNLQSIYLLNLFGIYVHAILFLIGLLLLTYIALKIYSLQTFILMFILVFTSLYFSPNKTFMLYVLSTTLLGFISYYYMANYWYNRKSTTLLVAVAMLILFVSYVHFMFGMENVLYYVMAHIFELIAYLLVLSNLVIILRAGKQRRKNGKKAR